MEQLTLNINDFDDDIEVDDDNEPEDKEQREKIRRLKYYLDGKDEYGQTRRKKWN